MATTRRAFYVLVLAFACLASAHARTKQQAVGALEGIASGKARVVDLSYAINDKLVAWPGDPKVFEATPNGTVEKDGYFTRRFWMLEHYGTHLDAPAHFPPGKSTVEKIAPEKFFGPAVVLDVRSESEKNADYRLSPAVIEAWEKRNGKIPAGALLPFATGPGLHVPRLAPHRTTHT